VVGSEVLATRILVPTPKAPALLTANAIPELFVTVNEVVEVTPS
jgi:hypothetical protein